MSIPSFTETHLWQLSELLDTAVTHKELNAIFYQLEIASDSSGSKQHRIFSALRERQRRDRCGNNVAKFLETVIDPARFRGDQASFSDYRDEVNMILAFSGLHLRESGKLAEVAAAQSLAQAHERVGRLRTELIRRQVHPDVLRFCRAELLQENYFHAVLESTKSVAVRIREMADLTNDGSELVEQAFGGSHPILAINTLSTETERSEQRGFTNLLKGVFGIFRNVTAHAPKVAWPVNEQDALDLLSLLSYVHRRLDSAVVVPRVT
ncbi:MAG: TIGR02391 family protein [Chloroflexi bacterium]|nr:TIGR02391 family protein [Chloroflexota bacterium]